MSDTPAPDCPRCMYLACKSMAVFGEDFENDPDYQAGVVVGQCTVAKARDEADH